MKSFVRSSALIMCAVLGLSFGVSSSARADESNMVRLSQQRLADLGYYTGRFDGIMGGLTVAAIDDFQASNGLPVTGALNAETYNLLVSADYRLFRDGRINHVAYVGYNDWRVAEPTVVHYTDGTAAFATRYAATIPTTRVAYYPERYVAPATVPVAYYDNGAAYDARVYTTAAYGAGYVATPVTTRAYMDDDAPRFVSVSYEDGCTIGTHQRTWREDDCR